MKLWTIQTAEAWQQAQYQGSVRADASFIEPTWNPAYLWMVAQMEQRIGPRPTGVSFPVWAWYQWSGQTQRKPDLRSIGHLAPGQQGVRLECEIAENSVLLSDFILWHHVLMNSYVPLNEDDDIQFERFEATLKDPHLEQKQPRSRIATQRIEESWQRIIDLDWSDPYITVPKEKKAIQATLWEIPLAQVKRITLFVAR